MIIKHRTFEAKEHERGSTDRIELNKSPITSEYMTSYKYTLCNDDGSSTCWSYRTKQEAVNKLEEVTNND